MVSPEEYRDEGQPDDAGGVHGEPDVFCFIEVWWNLPGLDSVDSAEDDEEHVVDEGGDEGEGWDTTGLQGTGGGF